MATISEARKKANKKWNDANMKERYDRVQLVLPKGRKPVIQDAADAAGESLNGYVIGAVEARMKQEGHTPDTPTAQEEEQ